MDEHLAEVEWDPIHRLTPLESILYSVTQFPASDQVVAAETSRLRDQGFTVASVDRRYDAVIGHVTEYWGYRK